MATRREFIRVSAAAGLAGLAAAGRAATAMSGYDFYRIVYDTRFADSRAFGTEASRLGQRIVAVGGDTTRLWRDHLSPVWRRAPRAIAGMTAPDALFCIEQVAYDAGLRAVLRIDHRRTGRAAAHSVEGELDMTIFDTAAAGYPVGAARAIDEHAFGSVALGQTCLEELRAGERDRLITWVFAPRTFPVEPA